MAQFVLNRLNVIELDVGPLATDACADVRSKPVKAKEQSIMEASVLDSLNMYHSDAEDSSGTALHEIKQRSNVAAWSGMIRHSILDICIEGHAMPVVHMLYPD